MKNLKWLAPIVFICIFIFSCSKEENPSSTSEEIKLENFKQRLNSEISDYSPELRMYNPNINIVEDEYQPFAPTLAQISNFADYITDNDLEYLDSIELSFGEMYLERSFVDVINDSSYMVYIPFYSLEYCQGILAAVVHQGHYHYQFYSRENMHLAIDQNELNEIDFLNHTMLTKINTVDIHFDSIFDIKINDYIYNNVYRQDEYSPNRNSTIFSGYSLVSANYENIVVTGTRIVVDYTFDVPCYTFPAIWDHDPMGGVIPTVPRLNPGFGTTGTSSNPPPHGEGNTGLTVKEVLEELEPDDVLCVEGLVSDGAWDEIQKFLDGNDGTIYCTGREEIAAQILSELCDEKQDNPFAPFILKSDVKNKLSNLANFGSIDTDALRKQCPCLADYFDALFRSENVNQENWLCKFVSGLDNGTQNVNFSGFEIVNSGGFRTKINGNDGTLVIPIKACQGTYNPQQGNAIPSMTIGASFIHEFLHFHMGHLIGEVYPNGPPNNMFVMVPNGNNSFIKRWTPEFYNIIYEGYVNEENLGPGNHHSAFLAYLKSNILSSLHVMNGGQGKPEDYEYFFHLIINTEGIKNLVGLPNFDISSYLLTWQQVGGNEFGEHPLFDSGC